MQQDAFVTVDVGQRTFARRGRGEARVIGEHARLAIELADVDDIRANAARENGIFEFARSGAEFNRIAHLATSSNLACFGRNLGTNTGQTFFPAKQDQNVKNTWGSCLPG